MAEKEEKRGGKRPGAGRPSLKKTKRLISLSEQANSYLEYYSKELGINKSDIVNSLCVLYLDTNNKDIIHCSKCGKPLVWEPLVPMIECEVECKCGYKMHIGGLDEI
ncbi:MAG: hypothetical protein ACK5LF_17405 [Bacteroides xylanisolvens]